MIKKLFPFVLILSSSFILGGCLPKKTSNQTSQPPTDQFSDIKKITENMQKGIPTYCTLTKGDDKVEYWLMGKKFKMKSTVTNIDDETNETNKVVAYTISDDSYLYSWTDQHNQGFKSKVPTPQEQQEKTKETKKDASNNFDLSDPNNYAALQQDGYTINCSQTNLTDKDFTPPADIQFFDAADMLKMAAPLE